VLLLKFDQISTSLNQNDDSGSKGMISAKLNFLAPLVLILLIALF